MKASTLFVLAGAALALAAGSANAQFFKLGNLVVTQVGDGAAALTNAGTQTTVREFNRLGTATGTTIAFGTTTLGSRLVNSGTATSEAFITASTGTGRYLTVAGYDATVGATGPSAGALPSSTNTGAATTTDFRRTVARIDTWTGAVDYSTFSNVFSGNNIRSAVYNEGTNGLTMSGATSGIRTGAQGATGGSTTQIGGATPTNFRVVNSFNGATVASAASGAFQGLVFIDAAGNTSTILNGFPTATGPSNYDFVFQDDRTVFVADDRTTAAGGLQRWTRSGGTNGVINSGTWALSTTFNLAAAAGAGATAGLRGLAADFTNSVLFAISTDNRLVSFSTISNTFTALATAPTNTAWRGVEIVPTPGAVALVGLGGLVAFRRRR